MGVTMMTCLREADQRKGYERGGYVALNSVSTESD